MLGLFKKDPARKIRRAYKRKLEEALAWERKGDLRTSSGLRVEAQELYERLEAAEAQSEKTG